MVDGIDLLFALKRFMALWNGAGKLKIGEVIASQKSFGVTIELVQLVFATWT